MTLNKRLLISSVLLAATAVTIFTINKSADAVEICDNTGQNTISAQVDPKNGEAQISNASDSCAYKVGVASFRQTANAKELYDVKYGVVKKNDTLDLNIEVPTDNYQYETFVGDLDNRRNIATEDETSSESEGSTPIPTNQPNILLTPTTAPTATVAPTGVPSVTDIPTPTVTPTNTPTPISETTVTPTPTPVYQIINNNNNTNNNTNEQRIIIEEGGTTREVYVENGRGGEVLSTRRGQPVYAAPKKITSTPNTGPEAFSLLAFIPTGIAGYLLRKKLR
jgi:hypothetical protein